MNKTHSFSVNTILYLYFDSLESLINWNLHSWTDDDLAIESKLVIRSQVLKYRKIVVLTNRSFCYNSLCTQNTIFQDTLPFHFYSQWVVMQSWNRGYFENVCKAAAVYTKQAYWGDSGIAPLLLRLSSKWEVRGRLYSRSNNHQWPLNRRLGGPEGWSGRFEGEEDCCPCHKSNPGPYGP